MCQDFIVAVVRIHDGCSNGRHGRRTEGGRQLSGNGLQKLAKVT